jgi:hypothetical protein
MENIETISIKASKQFYDNYDNYLKNPANNESNTYILNMIGVGNKLNIPDIVTKKQYLSILNDDISNNNSNNNSNKNENIENTLNFGKRTQEKKKQKTKTKTKTITENIETTRECSNYLVNFSKQISLRKQKCNICLEDYTNNYVISSCKHIFCFLCFNKLNRHTSNNTSNVLPPIGNAVYNHHHKCSRTFNSREVSKFKDGGGSKCLKCPKCPKCQHKIDHRTAYLISDTTVVKNKYYNKDNLELNKNNRYKLLVQLFKKNPDIHNHLLNYIGYKSIYFIKEIDKILKNSIVNHNKDTTIYVLTINHSWRNFLQFILPKDKLSQLHFLNIGDLLDFGYLNFVTHNSVIYIIEPLNVFNRSIITKFVNNIDSHNKLGRRISTYSNNVNNKMNNKMNNKTTIKEKHYKIINLIIKNTIDEKISNQSVILHD